MNQFFYYLLFLVWLSLNVSCKQKDLNLIDPQLLIGAWELAVLKENGNNLLISIPVLLEMKADSSYQKNDIEGVWDYQEEIGLTFTPDSSSNSIKKTWEVLKLSDEELVLENENSGIFPPLNLVEIYSKE